MTFRVTPAVMWTPLLALATALLAAGGLEVAARSAWPRDRLAPPSVGAPLRRLDVMLAELGDFARRGPVDCVFVGSSVVVSGIDPRAVRAGFERKTGRALRCFNLGLLGASAATAVALGRFVAAEYRPRAIVYATVARDYRPAGGYDADPTFAMPWLQQRRGHRSLEGWLIEHSAAYRQLLAYRPRLVASRRRALRAEDAVATIDGYVPSQLTTAPRAYAPGERLGPLFGVAEAATPPEPDLAPLAELTGVRENAVAVMLVEVPFPPLMFSAFQFAERDYPTFVERVTVFAHDHDVPFWRPPAALIPDDGWSSLGHMNDRGAAAFSTALGEWLAASGLFAPEPQRGE